MRERSDARSAVDVLADVTLLGRGRRARVQPHAHADRPRGEPLTRRLGGRRCSSGSRKRDEERVALRVDLDAVVRHRGLAHDPPVLRERVGVPRRPELVQQACRALDVGEQQRHRALRKRPHGTNDATRARPGRTSACAGSSRTLPSRPRDPPWGRRRSPSATGRRGSSPPPSPRARCRTRGSSCPVPRSAVRASRHGAARRCGRLRRPRRSRRTRPPSPSGWRRSLPPRKRRGTASSGCRGRPRPSRSGPGPTPRPRPVLDGSGSRRRGRTAAARRSRARPPCSARRARPPGSAPGTRSRAPRARRGTAARPRA